jgi:hypothetical protein
LQQEERKKRYNCKWADRHKVENDKSKCNIGAAFQYCNEKFWQQLPSSICELKPETKQVSQEAVYKAQRIPQLSSNCRQSAGAMLKMQDSIMFQNALLKKT